MYFDGARKKEGVSTSIDLLAPEEEYSFYFAYLLSFSCTNNVAK